MPSPNIWGNATWVLLHSIAGAYPIKPSDPVKNAVKELFNSLIYLFPCKICSFHLKEYLEKYPIDPYLESKNLLELYIYDLHNEVNKIKNVKNNIPTFEEVQKAFNPTTPWKKFGGYPYESEFIQNSDKNIENNIKKQLFEKFSISYIVLIIVIIIIALFLFQFLLFLFLRRPTKNE